MSSHYTPRRIVSLQPSATVILHSLGKLDLLVACTKYCAEVCPDVIASRKIIVADSWTAQCAQIVSVQPDLVIASVPYQEKAVAEILKSGTRFLGFAPKTLSDIYTDIAMIAGVVDALDQGLLAISRMQSEIDKVRRQTAALSCPRVYCEEWGKPIIASQAWVAELVSAAGGQSIGTSGALVASEAVLSEDPDVIIFAWCGAGNRVPMKKIISQRGWEKMRAARENRVYCIRDEFLNTPAPTLVLGLNALAGAIHPELFPQSHGLRCISDICLG